MMSMFTQSCFYDIKIISMINIMLVFTHDKYVLDSESIYISIFLSIKIITQYTKTLSI